jgi:hypothetical protein
MITPSEVKARNENILPYEKQIDETLSAPWTDEMQQHGRIVSYRLYAAARNSGVCDVPNTVQLERLRERYEKAGWLFRDDPKTANAWLFEYPKGKTP